MRAGRVGFGGGTSCWEFSAWVSTWLAGASVSIRELLDERVALQTGQLRRSAIARVRQSEWKRALHVQFAAPHLEPSAAGPRDGPTKASRQIAHLFCKCAQRCEAGGNKDVCVCMC